MMLKAGILLVPTVLATTSAPTSTVTEDFVPYHIIEEAPSEQEIVEEFTQMGIVGEPVQRLRSAPKPQSPLGPMNLFGTPIPLQFEFEYMIGRSGGGGYRTIKRALEPRKRSNVPTSTPVPALPPNNDSGAE
jgi:hypothetical protein